MKNKINVLIVEDHDIMILGLKTLLSKISDINVVSIATNGEEALKIVEETQPDIVIMDIDIPIISGILVTEHITANFPKIKVLIHTNYINEENIVKSFEAGASGFVPKTFKQDQISEAIHAIAQGDKYIKGSVAEIFIASFLKSKKIKKVTDKIEVLLTSREVEILKLVAESHSNVKVSETLNISLKTVEAHKHNIMKKLNVHTTVELVRYAIRNHLVEIV